MLTIDQYPRCKAYLAKMWIKEPFSGMNDYWCAVCIAESFSDKNLVKIGTVNFEKMTGAQLLAAFEAILAGRAAKTGKSSKKLKGRKGPMPLDKITTAVSPDEIKKAMTPKGGWKATTLEQWGILWPPPRGWREKLIANYLGKVKP